MLVFGFTNNAVDRYRQWYRPELGFAAARAELELAAAAEGAATKIRGRTFAGSEQWDLHALGIVLIAKLDDGVHVVVALLPPAALGRSLHARRMAELEDQVEVLAVQQASIDADRARAAEDRDRAQEAGQAARRAMAGPGSPESFAAARGELAVHQAAEAESIARTNELGKRMAVLQLEHGIITAELKTVRHAVTTGRVNEDDRAALRVALRYLHGEIGADEARAAIDRIGPDYLEPTFRGCHKKSAGPAAQPGARLAG